MKVNRRSEFPPMLIVAGVNVFVTEISFGFDQDQQSRTLQVYHAPRVVTNRYRRGAFVATVQARATIPATAGNGPFRLWSEISLTPGLVK